MTDLDLAYEECRLITRREAKNFYYAFLTLPEAQRRAIYVAYTFCRYCDDSVDAQSSVEEKLDRVGALRHQLDACYEGRTDEMVFVGLSDVARKHHIPREYFHEVLSGVESDLVKSRYQDFEELRRYCYQVASAVGLICIHIFGFSDPRAKDHAVDLGLAMQLTNIARDVKEDLEMGRIYLPQQELARFGYSEEALQAGIVDSAFIDLMRFQTQRARSYFHSGFQLLPHLSPRSRACPAVLGRLYSKVLDRIEARNYDVLNHRVSLSKAEKLRVTAFTWLTSMLPQWRPGPTL